MGSFSEIGGYFGLDLPDYGDPFPKAIKLQSGRAALRAVLESAGITKAFLPAYICDSAIGAVIDAGAVVETYWLDDALYPKGLPLPFPKKSCLLYVNYFGLCDVNIARLLRELPRDQLIVDNAQALLSLPADVLATIYSPRKFVGVPDGGLVMTSRLTITLPGHEDTGSLHRMKHLLKRMAHTAREGYADYLEAEDSLSDTTPARMSRLTQRILAGVDVARIRQERRTNFAALAARLDNYNVYKWKFGVESVPLCYPLILGSDAEPLKRHLVGKGIYIPTYWPDCKPRVIDGIEYQMTNCCLAIPCDQRYSIEHMSYLADEITSILDESEEL